LTKPVDQERLRQTVATHCGLPSAYALVVEDDIGSRQLFRRMLEMQGIRVREAENGQAALEQILIEIPAVILLDLMMPVMEFEFIRALRQDPRFVGIPVVVITAKELTAQERHYLAESVEDVMAKCALDREVLLAEITRILARAVPRD
jgi:CheY-like chemotaxis protein